MMKVLEVSNLHKKFGKKEIIKGVDFFIEEGEIFGLLGPNGIGKTTVIKMIVGFLNADEGSILIMGKDIEKDRVEALKNLTAIVENPEMYPYLSGMENLKQIARMDKRIKKNDIEEAVNMVGLTKRINDKVKTYSLGMKQRLGLAQAIMSNPKLIILDEPTNGLDPTGIIELRNILKKLARARKISILISSHILSEVQLICHRVVFMEDGQTKLMRTLNSDNDKKEDRVIIVSNDKERCEKVLKTMECIHNISYKDGKLVMLTDENSTPKIISKLCAESVEISQIYKKYETVEEMYMEVVNEGKIYS
ncbi:ABC transporter ATP-binding protein [Clostridium sp. P21]|uniref:ABC transporter ATP-binding protein n=1 Tax=Clostridium muellerianum TaxID=2716538 RepID=A0A7Y0ED82_9CLOT|nr:ABC transporter ATP-binding protein [Clostridium muellerianum]